MPVYVTKLNEYGENDLASLLPLLPASRQEKARRAKNREARVCCIVGYALLIYAARMIFPDAVLGELLLSDFGKPRLPDPRLTFSVSHTELALALAIGPSDTELGIDLERIRPLRSALIRSFASDKELLTIGKADDSHAVAIALWTKKEAAAKRSGRGILQDLRSLPVKDVATVSLTVDGDRHMLSLSPAREMGEIVFISRSTLTSSLLCSEKQAT